MTSQNKVRELFNLPKNEEVFDDFNCSLNEKINYLGRMYLTENYICFYTGLIASEKGKIRISIEDIIKISKKKTLVMFQYIKITVKQKEVEKPLIYKFSGFKDTQNALKIIMRLWKNKRSASIMEDSAGESDSNQNNRPKVLSTNEDNLNLFNNDQIMQKQQPTSQQNKINQINLQDQNGLIQELQSVNNNDSIINQETGNLKKSDIQVNEEGKEKIVEKQLQEIKVEKSQDMENKQNIEQIRNSKAIVDQDKSEQVNVTKEELDRLLEKYQLLKDHTEVVKLYLGIPVEEAYNQIMMESGQNSLEKYFEMKGEQNIIFQDWQDQENETYDDQKVIKSKQIAVEIQLKNNPFVKVSPTTKYYKLIEKQKDKIVIRILSRCTNVMYCDYFGVDEEMIIMSTSENASGCILRLQVGVVFYKSTMFQGKIQSASIQGATDYWVEWGEYIKKQIPFKETKKAGKLTHGIEKSNKMFEKVIDDQNEQITANKSYKLIIQEYLQQILYIKEFILENRTDSLLGFIFLFLLYIIYQLRGIQNEISQLQLHNVCLK